MLWPVHRYEIRDQKTLRKELTKLNLGQDFEIGRLTVGLSGEKAEFHLRKTPFTASVRIFSYESEALAVKRKIHSKRKHGYSKTGRRLYVYGSETISCVAFRFHNLVVFTSVNGYGPPFDPRRRQFSLQVAREIEEMMLENNGLRSNFDTAGNRLWEEKIKPSLPEEINDGRKKVSRALRNLMISGSP